MCPKIYSTFYLCVFRDCTYMGFGRKKKFHCQRCCRFVYIVWEKQDKVRTEKMRRTKFGNMDKMDRSTDFDKYKYGEKVISQDVILNCLELIKVFDIYFYAKFIRILTYIKYILRTEYLTLF